MIALAPAWPTPVIAASSALLAVFGSSIAPP
jgi:hypothetical protein